MKFTLGWLKDHLETDASLDAIVDRLTVIGLEVEEVVEKQHHGAARAQDRSKGLAVFGVEVVACERKLCEPDNRVHGRTKLMAHVGEELTLCGVGLVRLFSGPQQGVALEQVGIVLPENQAEAIDHQDQEVRECLTWLVREPLGQAGVEPIDVSYVESDSRHHRDDGPSGAPSAAEQDEGEQGEQGEGGQGEGEDTAAEYGAKHLADKGDGHEAMGDGYLRIATPKLGEERDEQKGNPHRDDAEGVEPGCELGQGEAEESDRAQRYRGQQQEA